MDNLKIKNTTLNFGPQHPSSHGVLRMVLELSGEMVKRVEPHIGQLHRGTEKLLENKTYTQNIPFMDRLDYVAAFNYEHGFVLAVEKMLKLSVPLRAKYLRVIFLEMNRIARHIFALGAHAMDTGAMTPMVWGFESRDQIMEFFEAATGARMHVNYMRVGGVAVDVSESWLKAVENWTYKFEKDFKDAISLVIDNRIFKQRTIDIGVVSKEQALDFSFSGPNLRASGIAWDLRKTQPYEIYKDLDFDIPVGSKGDSYDRFLVRVLEVHESVKIIRQCLQNITKGVILNENHKITPPSKVDMKVSMEALIHHFKFYSQGFNVPKGEVYSAVEAPTGEFGIYLISDGNNKPYRVKLRSNGFAHLQALKIIGVGHQLADLPSILGSLDVIFGEIDR